MNKKMLLLQEFLLAQLNHWTFFLLAFSVTLFLDYHFECGTMGYLEWAAGGLVCFSLYFIRKYIKLLVLSVLLHICALAVFCVIPMGNGPHIFVYAVTGVLYCALSIRNHVLDHSSTMVVPIYVEFGMAITLLLIINYYDYTEYNRMFLVITVILTGVHFIYLYLKRFNSFIRLNSESAGYLPAGEIFRSGGGLVIGFIVVLMLLVFFSFEIELFGDILGYIKTGLKAIAALLGKLLVGLFDSEGTDDSMTEFADLGGNRNELFDEPTETAPWMVVANIILWLVVLSVLIYIVVKLIIKAVKWLRQNRVLRNAVNGEGVLDVREQIAPKRRRSGEDSSALKGSSANIRIRRLYRKTIRANKRLILQGKKDSYLSRITARECAERLENERMAELYETARYSELEMNSADVREMRQTCRQ